MNFVFLTQCGSINFWIDSLTKVAINRVPEWYFDMETAGPTIQNSNRRPAVLAFLPAGALMGLPGQYHVS